MDRLIGKGNSQSGKILFQNSGAEANEAAMKLARKYQGLGKHGVVSAYKSFHGRTLATLAATGQPEKHEPFAPLPEGFRHAEWNNLDSFEEAIDQTTGAILVEPIQGEAGVVVPDEGYIKEAYRLCKEKNVLFIADEVQTGLGRTGKMLATDYEKARPDILILGKALSGGVIPASAVLADDEIMLCIKPGEHGSTFGGNPLACKVAQSALEVVIEEDLAKNASELGKVFRSELSKRLLDNKLVKLIRGKGEEDLVKYIEDWVLAIALGSLFLADLLFG